MPLQWSLNSWGYNWDMRVLDITTSGNPTQMFFSTTFPGDGSGLTSADADSLAAGLKTAVEALSGVTGCTLSTVEADSSPLSSYGTGIQIGFVFEPSEWALYLSQYVGTPSDDYGGLGTWPFIGLFTRSPADGVLTQADTDGLASGLHTAAAALPLVPSPDTFTMTQQVITPSSAVN